MREQHMVWKKLKLFENVRRAIMFGRIIKFRRGDQYEEMQGRDDAGKTARPTTNVVNNPQNDVPAATDSASAARDTTPDGMSHFLGT